MKQETKTGYDAFKSLVESNREAAQARQETTPIKEGLHTQGEWRLEKYGRSMFGKVIVSEVEGGQQKICILDFGYMTTLEEAEANAELIVKAVNERKALVNDLGDAINQIEDLKDILEQTEFSKKKLEDERKALLDTLKKVNEQIDLHLKHKELGIGWLETAKETIQTAINNAKNI